MTINRQFESKYLQMFPVSGRMFGKFDLDKEGEYVDLMVFGAFEMWKQYNTAAVTLLQQADAFANKRG